MFAAVHQALALHACKLAAQDTVSEVADQQSLSEVAKQESLRQMTCFFAAFTIHEPGATTRLLDSDVH